VALYAKLTRIIAHAYFKHGHSVLEAACMDICRWPQPDTPDTYQLPLLNTTVNVCVPSREAMHQVSPDLSHSSRVLVAAAGTLDIGRALKALLPQIQFLWELMLTAEPMIVRATTPHASSQLVLSLVSLILPIHYCGDYRPYFTIHDSDCQTHVQKSKGKIKHGRGE